MSAHAGPRWATRGRPTQAARRLASRAALLALLLVAVAAPAAAQGSPRGREDAWRAPRVLKWTLLATSVGLGLWAWNESRQADDAYDALRARCAADPGGCVLEGGAYADPRAEALFERSNAGDRRARLGLLAGQATLLGSAAFFIVDLRHGGPPENIPYDPQPAASRARLRVGLRVPLPR